MLESNARMVRNDLYHTQTSDSADYVHTKPASGRSRGHQRMKIKHRRQGDNVAKAFLESKESRTPEGSESPVDQQQADFEHTLKSVHSREEAHEEEDQMENNVIVNFDFEEDEQEEQEETLEVAQSQIGQNSKPVFQEIQEKVETRTEIFKPAQPKTTDKDKENCDLEVAAKLQTTISTVSSDSSSWSLFDPIPKGKYVQCRIIRNKKNHNGLTEYRIEQYDDRKLLLTVVKEGAWVYYCYTGQHQFTRKVAKIENSLFGSNFTLIKEEQSHSNLTVTYQTSFLGLGGPRKMDIYHPKTQIPTEYLHDCYNDKKWHGQIERFVNKQPKWNEKVKGFTLDFRGRAKMSSIKNFVITNEFEDPTKFYMIFAKQEDELYSLDIQWPFSIMQGVTTAISTFDRKLMVD